MYGGGVAVAVNETRGEATYVLKQRGWVPATLVTTLACHTLQG